MSDAAKTTTAFFYGTLMHPRILTRVIGNDGSHLEICPGVLKVTRFSKDMIVRILICGNTRNTHGTRSRYVILCKRR
jgi:hypothetical protein